MTKSTNTGNVDKKSIMVKTIDDHLEEKRKRIRLLFATLKYANKSFDTATSVHAYLRQTLIAIDTYCGTLNRPIGLYAYRFDESYSIQYYESARQVIMVSLNGSYAIYHNGSDKLFTAQPMKYYKDNEQLCVISILSTQGKTIWDL